MKRKERRCGPAEEATLQLALSQARGQKACEGVCVFASVLVLSASHSFLSLYRLTSLKSLQGILTTVTEACSLCLGTDLSPVLEFSQQENVACPVITLVFHFMYGPRHIA